MRHRASALRIDPVFQLVLDLHERTPHAGLPRRLNGLFRELAQAEPPRPADDIEDLIWAIWISHEDRTAEETMGAAVEAMASGEFTEARQLLDGLIEAHPDWAEAWNRRATAFFLLEDTASSMADLRQALTREPRHFGAWAGLGHILMASENKKGALEAYKRAFALHPHMEKLKDLIERLKPDVDGIDL